MNDKDKKKLFNKVFSKEELLEIIMEILKDDREFYSNSRKLQGLLALTIEKKQGEIFDEQEHILRKQSEAKFQSIEFFEWIIQFEKLDKKLELLEQCMSEI